MPVIFTDLDGSLLDEQYRFDAALESLSLIETHSIPLILASSKTMSELVPLAEAIGTTAPLIAENGAVVGIHDFDESNLAAPPPRLSANAWRIEVHGLTRATIIETAHRLRSSHGYQFEGFSDWNARQLIELTGLDSDSAGRALNRQATEPILWQDASHRFDEFDSRLSEAGIRAVRGGQFIHLMDNTADKAVAMKAILENLQLQSPNRRWVVIAAGDSPNDHGMLSAADVAVVLPGKDTLHRLNPTAATVISPSRKSSHGWNEAMLEILSSIDTFRHTDESRAFRPTES